MTENEYTNEQLIDFMYDVMDWRDVVDQPMIYAVIEELKEIQQYRAIGTVEELKSLKENGAFSGIELAQIASMQMKLKEYKSIGTIEDFKALKEKSEPKKPTEIIKDEIGFYHCPHCKNTIGTSIMTYQSKHCSYCGQLLDWSE